MAYHIRRAQWLDGQPVIAIGPHWNWPGREGQAIQVMVPTNAAEAELFLNGASLGRKTVDPFAAPSWQVPYAPGRLEAVGYAQGREVARARVETTGAPVRLRLTADRAMMAGTGRDVQPVSVDLLDSAGRHVPTATDRVTFTLTGGARSSAWAMAMPTIMTANRPAAAGSMPGWRKCWCARPPGRAA
jgi:beta-galactosidase